METSCFGYGVITHSFFLHVAADEIDSRDDRG